MKQAEREASDEEKANAANPLLDSGRQYLIRVDQAAALLRDETRLAAMHEASLRLGVRDATERIYETVMALVK